MWKICKHPPQYTTRGNVNSVFPTIIVIVSGYSAINMATRSGNKIKAIRSLVGSLILLPV